MRGREAARRRLEQRISSGKLRAICRSTSSHPSQRYSVCPVLSAPPPLQKTTKQENAEQRTQNEFGGGRTYAPKVKPSELITMISVVLYWSHCAWNVLGVVASSVGGGHPCHRHSNDWGHDLGHLVLYFDWGFASQNGAWVRVERHGRMKVN